MNNVLTLLSFLSMAVVATMAAPLKVKVIFRDTSHQNPDVSTTVPVSLLNQNSSLMNSCMHATYDIRHTTYDIRHTR